MQEYVSEQVRLNRELLAAIDSLPALSQKSAECERSYRISLAKSTLEYRANKLPVTLIQDITRGAEDVAKLRFERDVSKERLKATYEKINAIKLQMRILIENTKIDWNSQG
ncbi:hypothetical protein [Pectinatus frisingensis]|uniref:hypothetical protein n=1 Tax=Pectinatus frisingensis TaxID=865 RepID=UPI0018C7F9BB|nr:hypothetical protein [Pectinatus frisingensis]